MNSDELAAREKTTDSSDAVGCQHTVLFYEDDAYLIEKLTQYFGSALASADAVVVVASESHLQSLESRLIERGFDLERSARDDRYITVPLEETLERFMRDGAPNPELFFGIFDGVIARASGQFSDTTRGVVVFGELVANLVEDDNSEAAVALEGLWNQLAARRSFDLLCAYPIGAFSSMKDAASLAAICDLHTHVTPTERFERIERSDERQRAITQLQQHALALENEIALRDRAGYDQFIAVAAHELKTPISSLRAYAQLLLRGDRDGAAIDRERIDDAASAIETQTGKLTRLVSNVVQTLELDEGVIRIDPVAIDLAGLIRNTLQTEFADSSRAVQFAYSGSYVARVDPRQIQQVFLNLLDNAAKYSPPGCEIVVDLIRGDDGSTELSVSDQGIGIAAEHRAEIFQRFHRAHVDSHQSGIGLGLYVARNIVELHGGTLRLDASTTHGSRFVVVLPPLPATPGIGEPSNGDRPLPRVLVVDDDESIRQLIEIVLEDEGFDVDFASEGSEALRVVDDRHPDLILLDMRMPGMDGWEFVDRYRAQYGHRASIIVFTAAHNPAERGAEVDADAYIAKPFDLDTLIDRVNSMLRAQERQNQDKPGIGVTGSLNDF